MKNESLIKTEKESIIHWNKRIKAWRLCIKEAILNRENNKKIIKQLKSKP